MVKLKTNAEKLYSSLIFNVLKWIALSIAMAVPIGVIVGLFNILLSWGNNFRKDHEFMVYLLPFAGLIITFLYLHTRRNAYSGENLLKSEVQSAAKDIPFFYVYCSIYRIIFNNFMWRFCWKRRISCCNGWHIRRFYGKRKNIIYLMMSKEP